MLEDIDKEGKKGLNGCAEINQAPRKFAPFKKMLIPKSCKVFANGTQNPRI